jgi:hypothetical protein
MSKKDDERLRNLILFKVWATDEERDEVFGFVVVIAMVVGVIYLLARCFA